MPKIKHELRLFCLAIGLPALFVVAGGIRLLCVGWRANWTEAQDKLEAQTTAYVNAMIAEAEQRGFHNGPRRIRHGLPSSPPYGAQRPSNAPPWAWGSRLLDELPELCDSVRAAQKDVRDKSAFVVCNADGAVLYATPNYPKVSTLTAEAHLPPPFGDGFLRVAPADGGAAVRAHAIRLLSLGALMLALLVCTLSTGGIMLVQGLRRERHDARRKADFIDNVSHELKTPLAGIRLNAELLAEGRIADEARRRSAINAIITESDRLSNMVTELLDFSRLEKGTWHYKIETFDLAAFATQDSERQAVAAISRGRARITVKGEGTPVMADKGAIRQIGVNLVTNALKYSTGGIEIEVAGPEIRYMDRGPGIPRESEDRIFERFYRVDNSLAQATSGSGLGLPIARSLARGMGGDIVYSPRPGGGSVFTLKLKPACGEPQNGEA